MGGFIFAFTPFMPSHGTQLSLLSWSTIQVNKACLSIILGFLFKNWSWLWAWHNYISGVSFLMDKHNYTVSWKFRSFYSKQWAIHMFIFCQFCHHCLSEITTISFKSPFHLVLDIRKCLKLNNMLQYISNRLFCCFSFIIAMVNRILCLWNSVGRRLRETWGGPIRNQLCILQGVPLKSPP